MLRQHVRCIFLITFCFTALIVSLELHYPINSFFTLKNVIWAMQHDTCVFSLRRESVTLDGAYFRTDLFLIYFRTWLLFSIKKRLEKYFEFISSDDMKKRTVCLTLTTKGSFLMICCSSVVSSLKT